MPEQRVARWTTPTRSGAPKYEERWSRGGITFMAAFNDLMLDQAANDTAADFVREKIREIVKDPQAAELLAPNDHPIGTKRICVDTDYFDTYNRPNVTLVDLRNRRSRRSRPNGLRTGGRRVRVRHHRVRHRLRRDDRRAAADRHPRPRRADARGQMGRRARGPISA